MNGNAEPSGSAFSILCPYNTILYKDDDWRPALADPKTDVFIK